jgi:hypothetical protein
MSFFSSEPAVSPLWCAGKTSSAGSQKVYANSPAPKVRKNLFKYSSTTAAPNVARRIREIREDYALPKIPTRAFEANALCLEVVRLAYNLVTTFQRTCLPHVWQW